MAKWVKVCDEKALKDGDLFSFDHLDKKILVVKTAGKVYTVDRICTHEYADLSSGFLNEQEKTVTCPLHLSVFRLESGIPLNPPAELPLKTYDVEIEDNEVRVLVD